MVGDSLKAKNNGFTLVEMSIVLVIIGLIIGGVFAGQNLVKQARLRAVITEQDQIKQAVNAYRLRFNALPGDDYNAFSYFREKCARNADECNGNGNRKIEANGLNEREVETYRFWQHLNLAEVYPGSFTGTGTSNVGSSLEGIMGTNIPASKIKSVGITAIYEDSGAKAYGKHTGNIIIFGGQVPGQLAFAPMFSVQDAYALDAKADDGKPGEGMMRAVGTAGISDTDCIDVSNNQGLYNFRSEKANACGLAFILD